MLREKGLGKVLVILENIVKRKQGVSAERVHGERVMRLRDLVGIGSGGLEGLRDWACEGKYVCEDVGAMKDIVGMDGVKEVICGRMKWRNGLVSIGGRGGKKVKEGKAREIERVREELCKMEREREER